MFLDPIFAPLLRMPPFWAIFIISLVLSLVITIIYKLMTNQSEMKSLKEDIKKHQKEMKANKDNPQKVMEVQKKAMEKNMKYMMQSMKPTLVTFIPVILLLGWLNAHIAYYPINPAMNFTTTANFDSNFISNMTLTAPQGLNILSPATQKIADGKIVWTLNGAAGKYSLSYKFGTEEYTKKVLITSELGSYETPSEKIKGSKLKELRIDNMPVKPLGNLSIFGWRPGWLGTYIILSLIFSMSLRKLFKLY
jgi:uncharacterized membrane protein (DUF106 family)